MGWCIGSYLANDIWNEVKGWIPFDKQKEVAVKIVDMFENQDADCWANPDGIEGVAHPEWFRDYE